MRAMPGSVARHRADALAGIDLALRAECEARETRAPSYGPCDRTLRQKRRWSGGSDAQARSKQPAENDDSARSLFSIERETREAFREKEKRQGCWHIKRNDFQAAQNSLPSRRGVLKTQLQ